MRAIASGSNAFQRSECPMPEQPETPAPARAADVRTAGKNLTVPRSERTRGRVPPRSSKPCALFVAQLIATALDAPQTRVRRRAQSADAHAAYAAAMTGRSGADRAIVRTI